MCAEVSPGSRRSAARFARIVVLVVIAVAALYGVTTVVMGRRYEAELDRIRQRGEPVTMADLARLAGEPVPDSENAALVYQRIFKKLKQPAMERLIDALDKVNPNDRTVKTPKVWAAAKAAARGLDWVVPAAEEAAAMPRCLFPVKWEDGANISFEHCQWLRNLARVLSDKAVVYAHDGQTYKTIRCAELTLGLQNRLQREPVFISYVVRLALTRWSLAAAHETIRQCPVGPEETRRLYGLYGSVNIGSQVHLAWLGERAWGIWVFDEVFRKRGRALDDLLGRCDARPSWWYWLRPVMYADASRYLRLTDMQIAGCDVPFRSLSDEVADLETEATMIDGAPGYAFLSRLLMPVFSGARRARDRCQAEINLTRAALALVAYKDRFGSYPDSLGKVSSRLRWKVPGDPFSGKALLYEPRANGFVLYSIGPNLRDDGGKPRGPDEDEEKKGDLVISRNR